MATLLSSSKDQNPDAKLVAIVGMGCRWPGGVESPQQMWSFLRDQRSGFHSFDSVPRCFSATGFYHPDSRRPGTMAMQGAFLLDSDPRLFDHNFFGITGREAETLDPSQRKLLEVVYEAFENAGETWASIAGSNTGVFVGNFALDHWMIQTRDWDYPKPYSTTGAGVSILANRISHIFDLRGPSVAVDTACSSSMYAVHLAVSAIRNGDCDSAIVAASNWIADPSLHIALDKLGALSPTSKCHTFDASADGYARGEGFAALYIKRLSSAFNDGSPIRAIIRGTAVNANGRTGGITRPNAAGQEAVIRKAYDNAGLPFSDTTYLECHGTGTPAGDPIELAAANQIFGSYRSSEMDIPEPLFVGSVKTNMGHTEAASALASIMKVVLSLEAGEIPPNVGVKVLNPNIDFTDSRVEVVREVTAWPKHRPRRASVNSFGFGGANGHCIIDHLSALSFHRETPSINVGLSSEPNGHALNGHTNRVHDHQAVNYNNGSADGHHNVNGNGNGAQSREKRIHHPLINAPMMKRTTNATSRQHVLLPFSAHNESSLQLNIDAIFREIRKYPLADVAYTLSARRSDLPYKAFRIVTRDDAELNLLSVDSKQSIHTGSVHQQHEQPADVAFVFTGQGAQWHGMSEQLFEYSVFRTAIEHLDHILKSLPMSPSTWSIADILKGNCDSGLIQTPAVSQTACTAIQIGLVDLLASWSVRPAAVAGHSSGEIAAAYASGRATAADAIVAAYLRGRSVTDNKQEGAMLAVGLGPDQLRNSGYLDDEDPKNGRVQIAAINSPGSVTVSGDTIAIEALAARLGVDGIFHRLLKTGGIAYHSHHMIAPGQKYEEMLSYNSLHIRSLGLVAEGELYPRVPWVSSVTPNKDPPSSIGNDAAYWRANLESPVRFSDAISNLVRSGRDHAPSHGPIKALIEIGPHSALKGPLEQILKSVGQNQIIYAGSTLKRGEDARKSMLQLAGSLYCLNTKIDLVAVNAIDDDDKRVLIHGCTAIDLPPYQYTYGPINYYECRSSKEYRFRKAPRHDLLGSKIPGTAKLRPQWRNILRVKDLPWLGDHRLFQDAVFPATGYIAMAIEAALRTHEETPELVPKPTGYTLRNVSIKNALRLPEDDHGVEVILSMELVDATPAALTSWANFSISSAGQAEVNSIDSAWTEHCTGVVKIEVGNLHDKTEKIDTTSMDARVIDARSWYKTFTAIGLGYGPAFQAVANIRTDPDKQLASATVSLTTTAGMVKGGESRYAIHPTALDATLQLGLIACYGGRVEATTTAFVPVHFSRLYIGDGINNGGCDTAVAVALGELRGLRGAYINQLQMLDPSGDVVLAIEKLRCISYIDKAPISDQISSDSHAAFTAPFSRMIWKPDFRSLNYRSCHALYPPPKENLDRLVSIGKLTKMSCVILADVYETFTKGSPEVGLTPTPSGNIGHFFAWIKRYVEEAKIPEMVEARLLPPQERSETIDRLFLEIKDIVEAQIAKRLHENMADILFERQTGVDIMVHGDNDTNLLSALYKHGIFMTSAYQQLSRILDSLAHANPHLRILEVGAGTGGATRVAMKALTGPNRIKRYREYAFTDISPGFLTAAQASLAEFRDISYSVLDIEADPAEQGYQPVYDIVLASQVLHATASISQTLKNCQKLLRPQGKLVLVENTVEDSVIGGLVLGTLTGYWHGIPDGRVNGAFASLDTWDRVLREVGFSGSELELDDYPRPNNTITTLVSTLVENGAVMQESKKVSGYVEVQLLHSPERDQPLLGKLRKELEQRGISVQVVPLDQASSAVPQDAHVVAFLDDEKDFLLDTEGYYLGTFQYLAHKTATLLCLTFCGYSKGQKPEGALIPGLLRTVGTENPTGRFISIDVSIEHSDSTVDETEDLVRCIADQLFPPVDEPKDSKEENQSPRINDREFIWQDGCLWVSRAVPDSTLQSYAEISSKDSQERYTKMLSLCPLDSRGPVRAAFSAPGILGSLYFRPYTELLARIPSNYIDVKVAAVGINWKDLAVSSGRFDANNLSSEYAGIVTAVGTDAAGLFCVGDRVYGMGRGQFGNYTRVPAAFAQKLDAQDNLIEVATMPLVYMTAVYAFDYAARLRRGHKVLIQSATGGLGLAAIQLAQAKGAEVFAMVGTVEKADFLIREMKLPRSHVIAVSSGDSASSLHKKLAHMTPDGRGFDVILSTARGDVLYASAQALAPLGHLVDVGRVDVQESKALEMGLFGKSVSFSSFDLSLVLDADPAIGTELMKAVHSYYRDGLIQPIRPFSATDVSKLDQVLLKFSKGTHFGKLVVTFEDPQTLVRMPPVPSRSRVQFDPTAYYIVVGGLGGLGRSIIRWMCERGARNLVVLSRRGIEKSCSAAQNLIGTLTERGVNIQSFTCDISDLSQVTRLFQNISSFFPSVSLKGIIHAAVSYLDVSFDKLTVPRWRDSLAAKVQGTKNLHEMTMSLHPGQLDFFVMITSLESVYALATQSAYTAANAFQDAFARYRRRLGLPATSISFGFVKDIGELGQDSVTVDMFARNRTITLTETEFLARLEPAFLNGQNDAMSNDGGNDTNWIGQDEDPLSASNILTCLDPGAMAVKEREEEVDARDAGPGGQSRSAVPRWYDDARVSLIMRAFEDARRYHRLGSSSDAAAGAQGGDDNTYKSSFERIRRQFDAAIIAGTSERSKTASFVAGAITTAVAEMLFVEVSNVNPARAVADHGVDSLIAAELLNWFHQALGAKINMRELLDAKTSIETLAGGIVDAALARRQNAGEGQ
ncbi:uncharacterized protein GGS22DRAFT_185152 [Annulohypoxylon maeteangense]|uniref:uncharacterized protein n=1 Tax=Annulohypoxylon maeteangense TaxID=1927788 RepID=UPI00200727F6|nr:uncharacterized protein GGS22DRAFT_185152 [Annulohypoxylon maeteangense]KAI0887773.1 hypothetical protein GGS22DRAFT_185152 [Annulohypoxylon maeteangense]